MNNKKLFFFSILFGLQSSSQNLIYKSCGNRRDAANINLSHENVKALLTNNEKLLFNPLALTYITVAALMISIPVKIGFSRKTKNVVLDFNN